MAPAGSHKTSPPDKHNSPVDHIDGPALTLARRSPRSREAGDCLGVSDTSPGGQAARARRSATVVAAFKLDRHIRIEAIENRPQDPNRLWCVAHHWIDPLVNCPTRASIVSRA